MKLTMSEYVQAEIHETEKTVELRWQYGEIMYGLVMSQEMFDLLDISCGQMTPVLSKVMIGLDHPAWSGGVMLSEKGFEQR
jgi:hypothetical protein